VESKKGEKVQSIKATASRGLIDQEFNIPVKRF
jgi:hypothetical protein